MFYEDPAIVGQRMGWDVFSKLALPLMFKDCIAVEYEEYKRLSNLHCFQLLYEVESSFPQVKPDEICHYCLCFYNDAFSLFPYWPDDYAKEGSLKFAISDITDVYIKEGPLNNYIVEIFFIDSDEEGNLKPANFLFKTLPPLSKKFVKKYGKELCTPHQMISYLRSLPGYKSSL